MAYYRTCKGCALEKLPCKRREQIRTSLAGLSVTSVKFRCTTRAPLFIMGQRVSFPWRVFGEPDPHGDADEAQAVFHGTIAWEAPPTKFVVRVDTGKCQSISDDWDVVDASSVFQNESLIVKVRSADLTCIDQPSRTLCMSCLRYDGESECHGFGDPSNLALIHI